MNEVWVIRSGMDYEEGRTESVHASFGGALESAREMTDFNGNLFTIDVNVASRTASGRAGNLFWLDVEVHEVRP